MQLAYERQMRKLGNQLGAFIAQVATYDQQAVSNATTEQSAATLIAKELGQLQVRLRRAAATLSSIKAPANVETAHAELRQGVLDYASELDQIIALVRSGNFNALEGIATLKGVKEMQTASAAFARRGYAIA